MNLTIHGIPINLIIDVSSFLPFLLKTKHLKFPTKLDEIFEIFKIDTPSGSVK